MGITVFINNKREGNKMLKCKVCGCEFEASKKDHYVSRSNGKTGLMSSFGNEDECTLYDTFDCPRCGCQMVMKQRVQSRKKR